MRRPLTVLIAFVLTIAFASAGEGDALRSSVVPHTVVVKLRSGSPTARTWFEHGRQGAIESLSGIVGTHRSSGFVQDATLLSIERVREARYNALTMRPPVQPLPDLVSSIVIIEYDADIDPYVMASKLSAHTDLVYAEPLYVRELVGIPNDPLFAQQYHVGLVQAPRAWDLLPTGTAPIVVGIIDTGIDSTHDDLRANIWRNAGEMGTDIFGKDKRSNGEDDDRNGYVDDWQGWDFAGKDGTRQDNDPTPGHLHGSHVGGIVGAVADNAIGVAGVGRGVQIMSVKVGRDEASSTSVTRTSDAILYAAANGARVVNCSFGSASASFADADIVNQAEALGALVVGAAGNDGVDRDFYPAAHPNALSVASTDDEDYRSFFSNISSSVDVSAPGSFILSTVPGNTYSVQSGTSMAAPVVSAIAAMALAVDPSLTPAQLRSVIKANTVNIDAINQSFIGKIGTGRVDALRTLSRSRSKYVELSNVVIRDGDGDSIFVSGDRLTISIETVNRLDALVDGRLLVSPAPSTFKPILDVSSADLGAMTSGMTKQASNDIIVTLPTNAPFNGTLSLLVHIVDGADTVGRELITALINPSFRTIRANDLTLTVNSEGNIGYNDYPTNIQGKGVRLKDSRSYLFEGAFLVGTSPLNLPNVARAADPSYRDNSMRIKEVISVHTDSIPDGLRTVTVFTDDNDRNKLGLRIRKSVHQPQADSLRSSFLLWYDITNPSDTVISGMHAAMFWDWDIGEAGASDGCAWDHQRGFGFVQNTRDRTLPTAAVAMLSPMNIDFYAIDNSGSLNSPSIFDHFLRAEKWLTMSSGIARTNSLVTDVSMMIGGGPFSLAPKETRQIVFAVALDPSFDVAARQIGSLRSRAMQMGLDAIDYDPVPLSDALVGLEGGDIQSPGPTTVSFRLQNRSNVRMELFTITGQSIGILVDVSSVPAGAHELPVTIPHTATGVYVLTMTSLSGTSMKTLQIIP
jgi:serine protease